MFGVQYDNLLIISTNVNQNLSFCGLSKLSKLVRAQGLKFGFKLIMEFESSIYLHDQPSVPTSR
jgi:hypothetical protein